MEPYQTPNNNPGFNPIQPLTVQDEEHLKMLSITGYILGGITAFFACFGFMHVFMGLAIAFNKFPVDPRNASSQPPAFMGWFFVAIGATVIICGWLIGGLTILAARRLAARKSKTFVQVMAGFNCLSMPFGTTWGVCVFVVLSRPAVAALFDKPTIVPIDQQI